MPAGRDSLHARIVVGAVVVLVASACSTTEPRSHADTRPLVVATSSVLGDITREVVGEAARVEVLIGAGVDPHAYRPSAAEGRLLRQADLVVANGLGLEESLVDVLAAVESEGVPVFRATDHVELLSSDDDHAEEPDAGHGEVPEAGHGAQPEADHGEEPDVDHDHGPLDPHVLLDPVRGADVVVALGRFLGQPQRAEVYAGQVLAVHRRIATLLAPIPRDDREVLSTHDAFRYFAHRYDLELVGAVIPGGSTLAETSARDFVTLARDVARHDVRAILTEAATPTRLADALAREVGGLAVAPVFSDALGPPGSGADSYLGLLLADGHRIAAALR